MFDTITVLTSAIVLLLLDFIYLGLMRNYFKNQIEQVQHSKFNIRVPSVIACYLFLIFGINYFIIEPRKSILDAFLLGILIYVVYETTTYALFDNWKLFTVITDTLWGGILFALTTYIVRMIRK